MIQYKALPYAPRMSQVGVAPAVVTTAPASVTGSPVVEGVLWTALAAAASYAAIQTGMRTKGFNSIAGWAGGIAAGLGALVGLAGLVAPSTARIPVRWYWS